MDPCHRQEGALRVRDRKGARRQQDESEDIRSPRSETRELQEKGVCAGRKCQGDDACLPGKE